LEGCQAAFEHARAVGRGELAVGMDFLWADPGFPANPLMEPKACLALRRCHAFASNMFVLDSRRAVMADAMSRDNHLALVDRIPRAVAALEDVARPSDEEVVPRIDEAPVMHVVVLNRFCVRLGFCKRFCGRVIDFGMVSGGVMK